MIAIAAIGSGFLLISGNVDLSIGGQYALLSVVAATVAKTTHSPVASVAAPLLLGAALGLANGQLVRLLKISPLIVTIGTAAIFHGLAYVVTGGVSVFGFPEPFIALGRTYLGPVPLPVLISAVVFLVGGFVILRTVAGLRTYAIGGNAAAARLSGIQVERFVTVLYAVNGLLMGLVAVLATARLGSGTPAIGVSFELDVLTAAILGGAGFSGGSGHPLGIFVGVATIGVLNAGMIFVGLQDWYQQIARGSILLLALASDQYAAYRRAHQVAAIGRGDGADAGFDEQRRLRIEMPRPARRPDSRAAGAPRPIFSCQGLAKSFGSVAAVRGVGFSVAAGEIVCLVGDNGAGKSTVIKLISGVIQPDAGAMELSGRPLRLASPADARAARDRDRLPGPDPVPQSRRGAQPGARQRADAHPRGSPRAARRPGGRSAGPRPTSWTTTSSPSASSPADSDSRSPSPASPRRASPWSSSTSRRPRSGSPRPATCWS